MGIDGCSRIPTGSQEQVCRRGWLPQVATHSVAMRRRIEWIIQSYRDSLAPLNTGWNYSLLHTFVLIFTVL